jgi:hypothetical protein
MPALDQTFMDNVVAHNADVLDGNTEIGQLLADRRGQFDALLVSRPHNMRRVLEVLRVNPGIIANVTLIYDAEALFAEREILRHEVQGQPLKKRDAKKLIQEELALATSADIVLAVSGTVETAFKKAGHRNVHVLGHAVVTQPTMASFESRHDFLMVGQAMGNLSPNADAVVWFLDQVQPRLQLHLGKEVTLKFAGAVDSTAMQARVGPRFVMLGRLSDLSEAYNRARVFVAPTRYASGLPHKVHEAAARGVPCVVTPLLARQLGWKSERDLLVGSTPDEFANACAALYCDKELWERVRRSALARVSRDCNPIKFDRVVRGLISSVRKRQSMNSARQGL